MKTVAKNRMDEPGLNYRLAEILRDQFGLDAVGQADVGFANRRIDVKITITGHGNNPVQIALELEKYGANKRGEAVKDAASRLIPSNPLADLAIAMIYPKSCQAGGDLTPNTKLSYLHVTAKDVKRYTQDGRHDHKRHAKRRAWRTITVKEISTYVSNLHKDVGTPEIIASNLEDRLETVVMRLSSGDRKRLATSLTFNYEGDDSKDEVQEAREKNGAKRALLVVASAALFHTQLGHLRDHKPEKHTGAWPPRTLDQCISSDHIRQDLIEAWRLILLVDYSPIFESAVTVLEACTGSAFKKGIAAMASWASMTADDIGGLRHDILGRIFHRILDTARQDGSFYTSTAAAAFLATLAIPQGQGLKGFSVVDPACGTGTLLMAASERLRETAGNGFDPTTLINSVMHGIDINTTACHIAATTLGLLSPETNFDRMHMYAAEFGPTDSGLYKTGSLEMYLSDGLLPWTGWSGEAGSQIETGSGFGKSWQRRFSLAILNPPFTRNSLRHDQFSKKDEDGIKKREEYIFRDAGKNLRHSSDPMFILLAEKLLNKTGTLAVVRSMSTASSAGSLGIRKFLAKHFHIETIVVSFDPKRIWFSENTNINELLMVARRDETDGKKGPTKIVKLAVNPSTEAEAIRYAEALYRKEVPAHCHIQEWPRRYIEKGDWSATQFFSNHLADIFRQIRNGDLFKAISLGDVTAENMAPQGIRMLFKSASNPPPP